MTDRSAELLATLQESRRVAARRLEEFDATTRDLAEARGDSDTDDEHDPEGSTVAWDRAVSAATADSARRQLADIDAAIARVEAGWDGRCAVCGEPIPVERLEVRPQADRCVRCATSRR
ncbi:TraR/DksA family transcriptional regulator [Mobilicoccus massiliensis]|uniref:TraR/DksA family transcriptional regulator n=1 Tax=Mobilicoccus massiliensis TaxID=1522310 RepID=UPI00058EC83F|nr:TraR/DksA C4-type zinc finger protein [Mobilicoccus massiliensis]